MRRLGTILAAVAVLVVLTPHGAWAAKKPPKPPTYRCKPVSVPKDPHKRVPTPRAAPRRDPQPVVVSVPKLRCTGRNPQNPNGSGGGGVGGQAGGNGGVGNGDGHIPFTGFPMDVSLAVSLTLVACGGLLVVLAQPRRRIA